MAVFRIEPRAAPGDPRWLDGPRWDEVLVRADRPAQAFYVAAEMEAQVLGYHPSRHQAGGQSMAYVSSFHDETLYSLIEIEPSPQFPASGPPAVLCIRGISRVRRGRGGDRHRDHGSMRHRHAGLP